MNKKNYWPIINQAIFWRKAKWKEEARKAKNLYKKWWLSVKCQLKREGNCRERRGAKVEDQF